MDKNLICRMYEQGKSMRQIALAFNTNHKLISRILKSKNIQIRKPLNLRGKKKFKTNKERLYNNMATHLRFDITFEWFIQFDDVEKIKLLNDCITDRSGRWSENITWYKNYIIKFYGDKQFNYIYNEWISSGFEKYKKPSLDHIISKSQGGTNNIDNLQFLSWFENRCKNDMSQKEWDVLKKNINKYIL